VGTALIYADRQEDMKAMRMRQNPSKDDLWPGQVSLLTAP